MDGSHQLIQAVKENNLVAVDRLLKNGVNADARAVDGFTPLYWACCRGHVDICHRLLRSSRDVDAKGKWGFTALMAAADNGHETCVGQLLQHGSIGLNERSERGDSALHMAAYRGFAPIVGLLCNAGADVTVRNRDNRNPLGEAFINDRTECVAILNKAVQNHQKSLVRQNYPTNVTVRGTKDDLHLPHTGIKDEAKSYLPPKNDSGAYVSSDSAIGSPSCSYPEVTYPPNSWYPESERKHSVFNGTTITITSVYNSHHGRGGRDSAPPRQPSGVSVDPTKSYNGKNGETHHDSGIENVGSFDSLTSDNWNNLAAPHTNTSDYGKSDSNSSHRSDSLNLPVYTCPAIIEDVSGPPAMMYSPSSEQDTTTCRSSPYVNKRKSPTTKPTSLQWGQPVQPKGSVRGYNIPSGAKDTDENHTQRASPKTESSSLYSEPSKRRSKETNGVNKYDETEVTPGLKMSSFVEGLQMRVLMLEETLNQERMSKNDMRKEISRLKEENVRLKCIVQNLPR